MSLSIACCWISTVPSHALSKGALSFPTHPVHPLAGGQCVFVVINQPCVSQSKCLNLSSLAWPCSSFSLFLFSPADMTPHWWCMCGITAWDDFFNFTFLQSCLSLCFLFLSPQLCRSKSNSYFFVFSFFPFLFFVSFFLFLLFSLVDWKSKL